MKRYALIDCSNFTYTAFNIAKWYGVPFFDECNIYKPDDGVDPKCYGTQEEKRIVLADWMTPQPTVDIDYSWADLVISTTTEQVSDYFAHSIRRQRLLFNNPNVIHLVNGIDYSPAVNFKSKGSVVKSKAVFHPYHHFFCTVASANDPVNYGKKSMNRRPYLFEALVGSKKSPRSYIYYRLRDADLLDQSLVSLTSNVGPNSFFELDMSLEILDPWNNQVPADYRSPALDQLDNNEDRNIHTSGFSTQEFKRLSHPSHLAPRISELIPEQVYQNSWFSLITETNLSLSEVSAFITEKTVKALYGKRIFVFFGQRGHLQYLRSLGFKTFQGIIDESYDLEPDHLKRFNMAWDQVLALAGQRNSPGLLAGAIDSAEIYRRAKPILEHNFKVASDIKTLMTPACNFIQEHIKSL